MDIYAEKQIQDTVLEILKNSDLEKVTQRMVRESASKKLEMDLSDPERKKFVRNVVKSYIADQQAKSEAAQEKEADVGAKIETEKDEEEGGPEYDDQSKLIVCRLSKKRRVTVSEFEGKTLVSIRDYFSKGGKEFSTAKGIRLTTVQWAAFKENVPAIDDAIKKMECRLRP